MQQQLTIPQRKALLLTGAELQLAVEGKYTNIRIWLSKGLFYMRLDCYNQYSVPFQKDILHYLNNVTPTLEKLVLYPFGETPESEIDNILELTKDMKNRKLLAW